MKSLEEVGCGTRCTHIGADGDHPRELWGEGPWQIEPDRVDFRHAGFACLLHRNRAGNWCGYVGVPPGHPLHGVGYSDESPALAEALERRKKHPIGDNPGMAVMLACLTGELAPRPEIVLDVHGGPTYSGACQGHLCHVPEAGEPDALWWFGFDCGHSDDYTPAYDHEYRLSFKRHAVYRDLAYVRRETESLAQQLAALAA